ncbi:MAG: hypothetical protein IJN66_07080 [Muribaculaceae bacterium]|nr:hypothetical protein [Muribaculaceae bacterium]
MKQFLLKLPPYLPSVIVLMLLFYLTLVPQPLPPMEEPFLNFDKLVHVAMMAGVYLTFAFDYTRRERQHQLPLSVIFLLLVIVVLLGGFIELAQGTDFIHRGSDLWDFIADAVGAILASVVARRVMRFIIS